MIISPYVIPGLKLNRGKLLEKRDVIDAVCDYYDIEKTELMGNKRPQEVVNARQIGMYILRKKTSLSLSKIAQVFNRDHTTVIHSINKINGYLDIKDKETILALETICNDLKY